MAINQMLGNMYQRKEKKKIEVIAEKLHKRQDELNVFFEEFLELFDDKMSTIEDKQHPIWKAYNARYKEWTQLKKDIELANYYIRIV